MSSPAELGKAIELLAERVGLSVVGVGRGGGPGSGVVVGEGRVVTVLRGDDGGQVDLVFSDGRREAGRRIAADSDLALALVAADTAGLPAVEAAPAESLPFPLGAPVFALADPGGRGLRATLGFVAAAPRSFRGPRGRRIEGAIEHTAPLPRGSSGGPLLDADGRLLGLNLLRREGGLILAVPAGAAQIERLERLASGEDAPAPRLGVALAPARIARRMRRAVGLPERDGLLVRAVEAESPAARAGLARGDLLVAAGESELTSVGALLDALDRVSEGGTLALEVVRGTEELRISVSFSPATRPEGSVA